MTKKQAKAYAKRLNQENPEFTHVAKKQQYRDGDHWWVERSDGTGCFLAEEKRMCQDQEAL